MGSNDRPNAIANHVNATHARGPTGSIFLSILLLRLGWAAVGNLGKYFVGPGTGRGYFQSSRPSAFRPASPAIPREAFQRFNHTNFQLGGATSSTGFNNLKQSAIRPSKRHVQSAPAAVRTEAQVSERRGIRRPGETARASLRGVGDGVPGL